MSRIILNTCVVLNILRNNNKGQQCLLELKENNFKHLILSIVTVAELKSLTVILGWGDIKINNLNQFINSCFIIGINRNDNDLIDSYVNIDSYSKKIIADKEGNKIDSPIKMSKNDLRIAATASLLDTPLMTNDKDFEHLNYRFIKLLYL